MKTMTTRQLIRKRVRAKISGTKERPRLAVFISNTNVAAQLIDDTKGNTLAYASSVGQKVLKGKNLTEKAVWVGNEIASVAIKKKISTVVFDRGTKIYHGRVAALAGAAREKGLKF